MASNPTGFRIAALNDATSSSAADCAVRVFGSVGTADATITDVISYKIPPGSYVYTCHVSGANDTAAGEDAAFVINGQFTVAIGGVCAEVAAQDLVAFKHGGVAAAGAAIDGTVAYTIKVQVAGIAATEIQWRAVMTLIRAGA